MTTLYERLGGEAALDGAVFLFYEKMLHDPRVAHYFKDVDLSKLQKKMVHTLAFAFGDIMRSAPVDLRESHQHLALSKEDFAITASHLNETLEEMGVSDELRHEVMTIVASTKAAVLDE